MYGSSMDKKSTMNKKPVMIKRKYPHDMFKVDKKVAKNETEHKKLEKMGYTHSKPKMK